MNKKFAYISIAMMAFIGMSSCSDEDLFSPRDTQAKFTLTLPGQDVLTRATDPGLDAFNENTVATVDLFFYHTGETNQNAVLRKTLKASEIARNATSSNTERGMYVYDLTSSIGITELRTIFSNYDSDGAHTCEVYAIVNLPSDATITDTDIESLKQVELTCTAFGTLENAANAQYKKGVIPANFVMSGQSSTITLDATNKRKLVGNIDVFRSASKVTLELTEVKEHFTDANGNVWDSRTGDITVGMKHGQTVGYVEAEEHNISGDFTTRNIHMVPGTWINGGTATGHYKTDVPLYTYPNDWSNDLSHRTSLLVCVWWKNTSAGSSYQPTYYEIPISDEDEKLLRNYHYRIQLSIGIIGSLVEEEPVVLDHCSYVILPWGSNETILADMNEVRYLVVDETEIHMDNIIARSINYSSSHRIDTINKHLYVRDLQDVNATWRELPADGFRIVVKEPTDGSGTSYFTVEHDLVNNMDENSDYTQFKMEFDVYHDDQDPKTTKYIEHIIAYQTPMIYAEIDPNSDFADASLVATGQTTIRVEDENGDIWEWTADVNGDETVFIHDNSWSMWGGYTYPQVSVGEHFDNNHTHYNAGTYRGYYQTGYWTRYTEETVDILELNDPDNHYGYTFLNGADASNMWIYYDGDYGDYNASYGGRDANLYGGVHGLTGMNKNPNRYIIKATALTTDNFVIGDPRTTYVHNLNNNTLSSPNTNRADWAVYWSGTGYVYNNGRIRQRTITFNAYSTRNNTNSNYLTYYHPTDENNARTARMISPEFMVASSYGVCTTGINKENARKRCASYQEDGYPAGRWRLPTQAEVEYIVQLSAWGKIPILFGILPDNANYGEDSDYWSANGVVRVNSKTGKTSTVSENDASGLSVRCVYDTWYWTDKCQKDRFTWGDKADF